MTEDAFGLAVALVGAVCGLIALGVLVCELAIRSWRWLVATWDATLNGIAEDVK